MKRLLLIAIPGVLAAGYIQGSPILFERNVGQAEADAQFLVRAHDYRLLLEERGLRVKNPHGGAAPEIRFVAASKHARLEGIGPVVSRVNDYIGPPSEWVTGAPCWSRVQYRNLYPDIDLVFYGDGADLEYDVRVAPGGDPSRMVFAVDASMQPAINASGDLVLSTASGAFTWHKPVAYQLIGEQRQSVDASFALSGDRVSFHLAPLDRRYPLIIDPSLGFSTYLGGSANDGARGIAVDSSGNILIAGDTESGDLPGLSNSSAQVDYKGMNDAFVAKINSSGSAVEWLTYLGGTSNDSASAVTVDSAGNVYVTGFTGSNDFPVYPSPTSVLQGTFGGAGGNGSFYTIGDAFVTKLDPTGKLIWSTFLGGPLDDAASAIAVDASGNVFVTGATVSTTFPGTAGGYQPNFGGAGGESTLQDITSGYVGFDTGDAFVAKINPTGTQVTSTYLGGSFDDFALGLTIDSHGNIWVCGGTNSQNFPRVGAFQNTFGGRTGIAAQPIYTVGDGFIAEFSSDLKTLEYSTYFGGDEDDAISSLAVDSTGAIYFAGGTQSTNLPGASNQYHGPSTATQFALPWVIGEAFVAKLEPGGSKLAFSQYVGGTYQDGAAALVLDAQGNLTIGGGSNSSDFCTPTAGAISSKLNAGAPPSPTGWPDGFLARFNSSGTMTYCSYLGGTVQDSVAGLALDNSGNVYAVGFTYSNNFPTSSGVLQMADGGGSDVFITKLTVNSGPAIQAVEGAGLSIPAVTSLSPNGLFTIFGSGFTPAGVAGGLTSSNLVNNKLPTNIVNTCVQANGSNLGLFYVSSNQINALAETLPSSGTVAVSVLTNCGTADQIATPAVNVPVGAASPEFLYFVTNANGQNPVAAIDASNHSYIGAPGLVAGATFAPAHAKQVLTAFGVGWGKTTSAQPPGTVASAAATLTASYALTIGGVKADVSYAGLSPGFAGLYQINFTVPSGLSSANQALVLTTSGASSPSGAYITVSQ